MYFENRFTDMSRNFDICGAGSVDGGYSVYDPEYIPPNHVNILMCMLSYSHVAELFQEIHDVCTIIHIVLQACLDSHFKWLERHPHLLKRFKDARVKIFIHISMLDCKRGCLHGSIDGRGEMRQQTGESHANLEWVHSYVCLPSPVKVAS